DATLVVVLDHLFGKAERGGRASPGSHTADFEIRAGTTLRLALLLRDQRGELGVMLFDAVSNLEQASDPLGVRQRRPRRKCCVGSFHRLIDERRATLRAAPDDGLV